MTTFICTTPSGIDFKACYEYESSEPQTRDYPGSPENLYAWPKFFSTDELAIADAWVFGSMFTDDELKLLSLEIGRDIFEKAWEDIAQQKALAEEYRVEAILDARGELY